MVEFCNSAYWQILKRKIQGFYFRCSRESVVAAVCGWVILREAASGREIIGACLVFAAILIAQIQIKKRGATGHSAK